MPKKRVSAQAKLLFGLASVWSILLPCCQLPVDYAHPMPAELPPISEVQAKVLSARLKATDGKKMLSVPAQFKRLGIAGYEKHLDGRVEKGVTELPLSESYTLSLAMDLIGGSSPLNTATQLDLGPHGEITDDFWHKSTWFVRECRLLKKLNKANRRKSVKKPVSKAEYF